MIAFVLVLLASWDASARGGVPFIATFLSGMVTGVPLIGLLYPMTIAGIGVIVSTLGLRRETHQVQIWDEVVAPR